MCEPLCFEFIYFQIERSHDISGVAWHSLVICISLFGRGEIWTLNLVVHHKPLVNQHFLVLSGILWVWGGALTQAHPPVI